MTLPPAPEPQAIVLNLHWRHSGVTATARMVAPALARHCRIAWLGPGAPEGVPKLSWRGLFALWRGRAPIVWHARRNNEMLVGVALAALGWPLRLVFTSAAQRHHTWITRSLMRRMRALIATSEAARSYLAVPDAAVTVIPHGVDTQTYRPAADRAADYALTGLPGRYGIGCFGRVRAQKGTDLFVEAMCRLLPRHPDFCAVILGEVTPDQRDFATALVRKVEAAGLSDRIRFLGAVPNAEVIAWYRRVLIYAFTSRREGFGLTLLESMASGAALVAARAGAAETVVRDGDTGILVPAGDAAALTAALERLMADPEAAAEMGARARRRTAADFGIEAEAARIAAVYAAVLEG